MKYTLTLLFLYHAEVRYALQLRHLSSKIQRGYVTRKSRILDRFGDAFNASRDSPKNTDPRSYLGPGPTPEWRKHQTARHDLNGGHTHIHSHLP